MGKDKIYRNEKIIDKENGIGYNIWLFDKA